jgi:tetratricopeptide (TPR) repeat protein
VSKSKSPRATSPPDLRGRVDRAIRDGKFQTGLDLARQLLRAEPTSENRARLCECYLGRARQLLDMGSSRDALVCLDVGLPQASGDPASLARFAEEFARCGEVRRALDLLGRLPEPRPPHRVLPLAADAALQRGTRESLPEPLHADFDRVRNAFAKLHAAQDDAVRELIQGIGLSSPFLEWKVLLRGLLAYYQHDEARALENWSRLDTTRLPARLAAPLRLTIDRDFAAAQPPETQTLLRRQADRLTNDPVLAGLRRLQAALARSKGRPAEVLREAEGLLPLLKERDPRLAARLARVLYWELLEQGRPDDVPRYIRVFGRPADDPEFARLSAMAIERDDGNVADAHHDWQRYEKALATLPGFTDVERRRARAMVWHRMAGNALRYAAATNRDLFLPFERPGRPLTLNPNADKCLRRATELAPDWLEPHVSLVDFLERYGKPGEAINAAETLAERFPDHLPTLEKLARGHQENGDFDKSARMLERALAANPLNRLLRLELVHTRRRLGTRLAAEGEFAQARAAFEAARGLEPGAPHPLVDAAWAACEFKAGDAARAEELLSRATDGRDREAFLDGWVYAHAANLKLPKAVKDRFERPLKAALDAESQTPEQAAPLLNLFMLLEQENFDYHGAKTHRKKALAQIERTAGQPYTAPLVHQVGMSLMQLDAGRVLRKLAGKWSRDFPENPWPSFFLMESYLAGSQDRWPLWRVIPLAERAKALGEKMPPGPERDNLLMMIGRRLEQLRDLNPFDEIFQPFGDSAWEEDDSW